MDGLLIIDKPAGPTSHDVVARVRRALGEPRVGHTGTLDPAASGVLPLVLGRATRLAQFLSQTDKIYEATIALGVSTDTGDALGQPTGQPYQGELPTIDAINRALDAFRGSFAQQPPAFSAKRVGGRRSYKNARAHRRGRASANLATIPALPAHPALPAPVIVTTHALDILSVEESRVTLRVHCSAGFYVRSLAHDLGARLGTGGHLASLRRTESGRAHIDEAVPLADVERDPASAARVVVPLGRMLSELPSRVLTPEGARRASHGHDILPRDMVGSSGGASRLIRLLDSEGDLLAIAEAGPAPGLLHPFVVLK